MSEPAPRALDVRVGSSTDALTPVSVVERRWRRARRSGPSSARSSLAAIAADQLTKLLVSSQLALDESLHVRRAVRDPPRPELRDRLRAVLERDGVVIGADRAARWAGCWSSSPARGAAPGAAGRARAADRRRDSNLIDRVRLGHVTDFLDLRYWPAFNLADRFIVSASVILFAALLLGETSRRPRF